MNTISALATSYQEVPDTAVGAYGGSNSVVAGYTEAMHVEASESTITLRSRTWFGWPAAFFGLVVFAFTFFTIIPGTIEGKSLAVLHGLCAQQPTHSYYFGEARLPFDARMTGIYGGFAMTTIYLWIRGRWGAAGLQHVAVIGIVAAFIVPLGFDGSNSFLKDAGLPYLYEPRNMLRTATGLLVGASLGTFVWMLIGQTAFRPVDRAGKQIWNSAWEILLVACGQLAIATIAGYSGFPLRIPLTYLLIASAIAAVTGLLLPFVLLVSRREQQAMRTAELAGAATVAMMLAFVFVGAMSGGRFALEALLGLPAQVSN